MSNERQPANTRKIGRVETCGWFDVFISLIALCRLTKKAEPPPIRGVDCNRSGNGGWLRRLVRRHLHVLTLPTDVNQRIVATSEIQATTRSERCRKQR